MDKLSLLQLNTMVQSVIEDTLNTGYWVEAEIASANENRGHLFAELIEKKEGSNAPIAKASAKCWANTWYALKANFVRETGNTIRQGMKVLLCLVPQFHPAYGFSYLITDIDPTYTIGDMAKRRREIIAQLIEEGVYDLQRQLTLPMFCQDIAVISSQTAAGYGDFVNQLTDNEYGFCFYTRLYSAIMQGDQVEASVIKALNKIYEDYTDEHASWRPTCVVIIRGGGATSDLVGFDSLLLAENVANFPLPIITGIGHERDDSIIDLISHLRVKTPTAAAAFLIERLANISNTISDYSSRILNITRRRLEGEHVRMETLKTRLPMAFSVFKATELLRMATLRQRYNSATREMITRQHHKIERLVDKVEALDPQILLNRGYSMTLAGGRIIKDSSEVINGEIIETMLAQGKIISKVITN